MIANKEDQVLYHGTTFNDIKRLVSGRHHDPHSILGPHPVTDQEQIIRAWHPQAQAVEILVSGPNTTPEPMTMIDKTGLFALLVKNSTPLTYKFIFHFLDGSVWTTPDPYAFTPGLGELDLHLINEGRHQRLYDHLGAHLTNRKGIDGVSFALWAPNAERVSVVGDFNQWDGLRHPMRSLGSSGIWEIFMPELPPETIYKYEIRTPKGDLRLKTDPLAFRM
ncbi:MAG: 1,4-alpha-glucan branching enzyme, partial [Pseudomonadota bacterium]|nr:1,4-alpha-glucan branching enzyme [Pseudomonadota bacterium]